MKRELTKPPKFLTKMHKAPKTKALFKELTMEKLEEKSNLSEAGSTNAQVNYFMYFFNL